MNFDVTGAALPPSATAAARTSPAGAGKRSALVLHPENPYCPTAHMNVRFVAQPTGPDDVPLWWLGGGMDLTPYYPRGRGYPSLPRHLLAAPRPSRRSIRATSVWCDDYFFLKHRNEPRGVGGIFDDLNETGPGGGNVFERCFALTRAVGDVAEAYLPIVERRLPPLRRAVNATSSSPARPLRRVQSGVGPWHAVRPAVGRPDRIDPDVAATHRQMAL